MFRSEADVNMAIMGSLVTRQVTVLKWRKNPLGLDLTFRDPVQGTRQFVSDGSSLIEYSGVTNLYSRRRVEPSLSAIAALIDSTAPQMLSPVIFLQSGDLPPGIESARVIGYETIGGQRCLAIRGTLTERYSRDLSKKIFRKPLSPTRRGFTVWIGEVSQFLVRSTMDLAWSGMIKPNPQKPPAAFKPRIKVTETSLESSVNPVLDGNAFKFTAPKGAEEMSVASPR